MKIKQQIRDYKGKIIGTITVDDYGNKEVRDFYGRILGKYDKKADLTRDFYGRIIARGDQAAMLLNLRKN